MEKLIKLLAIILALSSTAIAQNFSVTKDYLNKTIKQINDSLPSGWTDKIYTARTDEIVIQSLVIDLYPDMTSNDRPVVEGQCEIYIMIVPRVSPDSINIIRKRNEELRKNLPPQYSQNNLQNWYNQNEKTLKILDSEPTNYDNIYSYRIKCSRSPKRETDIIKYNKIMAYLNRLYKKYRY